MKKILIICTANKTRSVMAVEIANSIALKTGAPYSFSGAGIALVGGDADNNVNRVLSEIGMAPARAHVSVSVNDIDMGEFDAFHVMNRRQKITLCSYFKNLDIADKITTLNIHDPFSKGLSAYRECRDKLLRFYEDFITNGR
ncbi:MAG: hypothetical protein LBI36_01155 [Oscillospiraceae bacterium]|jgi:protein-tyrosine-phosphatase|nr:hypothetical protein [Oscillospiraceae bacterium]